MKPKLILLNQNLSWCYHTDADFAHALMELPKPDLSHTAYYIVFLDLVCPVSYIIITYLYIT